MNKKLGFGLAIASYMLWGVLSLYWHLLAQVNSLEVFSYRILSTMLTMLLYFLLTKKMSKLSGEIRQLMTSKKATLSMLTAALLIATNWLTYIYMIATKQATAASLGYYVMPILSVLLAVVFLREKISRWTLVAIIFAFLGVLLLTFEQGHLPVLTLVLALSFGFYGLLKKNVKLSSDVSITLETVIIMPFVLIFLVFFAQHGFWNYSFADQIYLAFSGIITAIPLLLFAESLKHAQLNTVGFLQYVNPTLQLLIALFVFKESLSASGFQSLLLILLSIVIFVIGQVKGLLTK